ncbi:MAG: serine/threonine-protein phosphatase [Elusimicrobia bacterium]|nr:serine/threonine-protein phosphatase [Elusimicrobiota bacterium]
MKSGPECVVHAASDVGRIRSENQDAWFADASQGLFLVADGMGGMTAGGVAAKAAVEIIPRMLFDGLAALKMKTECAVSAAMRSAVAGFSSALYERSKRDPRLEGTGTTVVLALVQGRSAFIANLGDSRAYLFKGGLRQLTEDHSLAAVLQRLGKITPEQAALHPGRNTLTRFAGMEGKAEVDVKLVHLKGPCRLLLCSDGLTGMLSDERIEAVLAFEKDGEAACRRLVEESNEAGGKDNVTVMVADLRRSG